MLTGIMDAEQLSTVLEAGLLPFLRSRYPAGHCLRQDNDPKHASRFRRFFGINWVANHPESPHLNPIENM